ncbi:hypothetical protein K2X85_08435 [bacterium]|nr:hypothetical protein [bacterium]
MALPAGARFPLGRIVVTEGASWTVDAREIRESLSRHVSGDWGDCELEDCQRNERALEDGARVFSVYRTTRDQVYWVITEADRSVTTVLLSSEY